jgi:hypothetical protein
VCELAIVLQLLVVTICKCAINLVTNPNPIYSDIQSCDNINTPNRTIKIVAKLKYFRAMPENQHPHEVGVTLNSERAYHHTV